GGYFPLTLRYSLDVPVLLPDAPDGRDRCVHRLTETLRDAPGISQVHLLVAEPGVPARLCMHFDPEVTSLAHIRDLAEGTGATLTEQVGHRVWRVAGITHQRRARTVAESLRRVGGVLEADVAPGLVRVEVERFLLGHDRRPSQIFA
ncbi:MAG TPA: hypothetical protein PLV68_13510, partial [Ilumatobacteraceae bacterium]|nr:hypothetical protein [Ilumatobacteraceae bacterium]